MNRYKKFLDIEVPFEVLLGKINISIHEMEELKKGDVIDLKIPNSTLPKFYINDTLIGNAEVMVFEKNLGIKINNIYTPEEQKYELGLDKIRNTYEK